MMPKHLISVIGLVISLGVIALGVMLVALPLYLQAGAVALQTVTVADTNDIYQAQVDSLREDQQRQSEIEASVATLRAQIPATPQLDDAFEVVARAAEITGVSIEAVTAGALTDFVERTGPDEPGAEPVEPLAPAEGSDPTSGDTGGAEEGDGARPTDSLDSGSAASRQQVEFSVTVVAADMRQATEFLDTLRIGPRLLSNVTASVTETEPGKLVLAVEALTFVDAEE